MGIIWHTPVHQASGEPDGRSKHSSEDPEQAMYGKKSAPRVAVKVDAGSAWRASK